MSIRTIRLDLAKNVFQVYYVDEHGRVVLSKQVTCTQLAVFFANLSPCLVGMEACGSAHFWVRKLSALGHEIRLMAPLFVKPYVKGNKTDAADTEAICEAMSRPNMRFMPVKLSEQQTLLAAHRAQAGFVKARTGHTNQLRGLLTEFGIAIPVGLASLRQRLPILLAEADNSLSGMMRELIARLTDHFRALDQQAAELEKQIQLWHRQSEPSQRLAAIPGIGPITATALIASIGGARAFSNDRQPAASAAAFQRRQVGLARISKRGDVYLRTLLIHGARAVISHFEHRCDQ